MQKKELIIVFLKKNKLKQSRPQFLGHSSKENNFYLQNTLFHIEILQNSSEDNKKP